MSGECVEVKEFNSQFSLSSGVWGDATSISLPAGNWEIDTLFSFVNSTESISASLMSVGIGTAAGDNTSGLVQGDTCLTSTNLSNASGGYNSFPLPSVRKNLSASTTFYLKMRVDGSGLGNIHTAYRISARRYGKVAFAFGDSITSGSTVDNYSDVWAPRVASTKGLPLRNYAVSGTRISDHLTTMQSIAFQPDDVVLLLTGYNDMRYVGTDSAGQEAYRSNLNAALDLLQKNRCQVYIGNCLRMQSSLYNPPAAAPYDKGSDTAVAQFNAIIQACCADRYGVLMFDACSVFDPSVSTNWGWDGIHPSATPGHQIIANKCLAVM